MVHCFREEEFFSYYSMLNFVLFWQPFWISDSHQICNFIRNMGSIKSVISKKKDLYSFYNMVPCLKVGLEVVVFLDLRKIQNTVQSTYNEKLVILNK